MSFRTPNFSKHATSDIVARQTTRAFPMAKVNVPVPRITFLNAAGTVVAELRKENSQGSWEDLEKKAKDLVKQKFAGAVKYEVERPKIGRKKLDADKR